MQPCTSLAPGQCWHGFFATNEGRPSIVAYAELKGTHICESVLKVSYELSEPTHLYTPISPGQIAYIYSTDILAGALLSQPCCLN
jgi:hypothetical protein